ncbi:MAG: S-adenosylmethionine decarboxylase proenzyme [bacterium]|nr:MAG: S-adenosylmethionine decarboxylase proenzyme [bacterium]
MKALGRHILVEYYDCDPGILNDRDFIEGSMKDAARKAGATIVDSIFQRFSPHGISGVVVIAESHLAIHTWPEYGYAAVDLFTCGKNVDPWVAHELLRKAFRAGNTQEKELLRGDLKVLGADATFKPVANGQAASSQV